MFTIAIRIATSYNVSVYILHDYGSSLTCKQVEIDSIKAEVWLASL